MKFKPFIKSPHFLSTLVINMSIVLALNVRAQDFASIVFNEIEDLYGNSLESDTKGLIWVGFCGDGLDRFDPAANTFNHFRHDQTNKKSIAADDVRGIKSNK